METFSFTTSSYTVTGGLLVTRVTSGYKFAISWIDEDDIHWDALAIEVTDGVNTAGWTGLSAEDLTGAVGVTEDYGIAMLGALEVSLNVTDIAGNGYVSAGDYFVLIASFNSSVEYDVTVIYEPTGGEFAQASFGGVEETPTAALTRSTIALGFKFNIVAITLNIPWDDLSIALSDGTQAVVWTNMSSDDLDGGEVVLRDYGVRSLGDLDLTLKVCDLAGNGLTNSGDYFTITLEEGAFDYATTYCVTLIYEPTDGQITHMSFSG